MKYYISSHDLPAAKQLKGQLEEAGHTVVSEWHERPGGIVAVDVHDPGSSDTWTDRWTDNTRNIEAADALVLIAGPQKYPGGKFVEAGYAYKAGKPIIVLGRAENGMVLGACSRQYDTVAEFVEDVK